MGAWWEGGVRSFFGWQVTPDASLEHHPDRQFPGCLGVRFPTRDRQVALRLFRFGNGNL